MGIKETGDLVVNPDSYRVGSGWRAKEDDTIVNIADLLDAIANLGVTNKDPAGRQQFIGTFGDAAIAVRKDQIAAIYSYDARLSEIVGLDTLPAGFEVTIIDSNLVYRNILPGSHFIESLTSVRYRAAQMIYAYGTAAFVAGLPVGTYFYGIGICDAEDGFQIGIKDGLFGIRHRRTDRTNRASPTLDFDRFVEREDFNLDKLDGVFPSKYNITDLLENGNVFMITYGYLGYAPITFSVKTPDDQWIAFHRIEYPGTSLKTNVSVPYAPLSFEIDDPNGLGLDIRIGSIAAGTLGGNGNDPTVREQAFVLPMAVSVVGLTTIALFRQPQEYKQIRNKIGALLKTMSAETDGAQGATIRLEFNPDIITPGTWATVADDGPVEYSLDEVVDIGTGKESGIFLIMGKTDTRTLNVAEIVESRLRRGQVAHFYAISTNASIDQWAITYNDEF